MSDFVKTECNIKAIHDEFVRLTRELRHKEIRDIYIEYTDDKLKACVDIDDYTVKLPSNGGVLADWASMLNNCMAGYFHYIYAKTTVIYIFLEIMRFSLR